MQCDHVHTLLSSAYSNKHHHTPQNAARIVMHTHTSSPPLPHPHLIIDCNPEGLKGPGCWMQLTVQGIPTWYETVVERVQQEDYSTSMSVHRAPTKTLKNSSGKGCRICF